MTSTVSPASLNTESTLDMSSGDASSTDEDFSEQRHMKMKRRAARIAKPGDESKLPEIDPDKTIVAEKTLVADGKDFREKNRGAKEVEGCETKIDQEPKMEKGASKGQAAQEAPGRNEAPSRAKKSSAESEKQERTNSGHTGDRKEVVSSGNRVPSVAGDGAAEKKTWWSKFPARFAAPKMKTTQLVFLLAFFSNLLEITTWFCAESQSAVTYVICSSHSFPMRSPTMADS